MKSEGHTRRKVVALLAAGPVSAQMTPPPPAQAPTLAISALAKLRKDHPRLLLTDDDLEQLRGVIHDMPQAHRMYTDLSKEADRLLAVPPLDLRTLGSRSSATPRYAIDRIYTLALLYRLDRKRPYLDRAVKEMHNIAASHDWNPARFLDTAEMTHAMAIGYDWLYEALSPEDRQMISTAIFQKGLDLSIPIYERQISWTVNHYYWNPVCNGSLTLAALAVAEDDMQKCEAIVRFAVDSLPRALASYGTDGGWPEGENYWNYATRYVALMLAGLGTAVGNDFGLGGGVGKAGNKRLERTGRFRLYTTGPSARVFNFADNLEDEGSVPEMFWLARHFVQPPFAWLEAHRIEKTGRFDPLDLTWYERDQRPPLGTAWPLDAIFPGVGVASFRSNWEDPDALFLAAAAHDNSAPHAHLDLGNFVFEAGGVRWALDMGPDDNGSGTRTRTAPRTRADSHNTLTIDGENQDPRAEGRITRHEFTPDLSWVQFDLSHAYPGKVKTLQRRIGLAQRQAVLIQDSMRSDQAVEAVWGMMTEATVTLAGQRAELRKDNWVVSAEILTPRHALFDVEAAHGQASQMRKLIVRLGEKVTDLELNIVLTPYKQGQPKPKIGVRFPAAG